MGQSLSSIPKIQQTILEFYYRMLGVETDFGHQHRSQPSAERELSQRGSESLSGDFQRLSFNTTSTSDGENSPQSSTSVFGDRDKIQESHLSDDVFSCNEKEETNIAHDNSIAHGTLCPSRECALEQSDTDSGEYNIDDLCRDMIEAIVPRKPDGAKVFIINVEEDGVLAKELTNHLHTAFGCRAAAIETFDPLYRMCGPQALAAVQKWAEIMLVIISPASIRAIRSAQPTYRPSAETTRYHFSLIQAKYMQSCCINDKVVSVIQPGTDPSTYSGIIELRNAYSMDDIKENFQAVIDFMKVSKRGMEMAKSPPRRPEGDSTEGEQMSPLTKGEDSSP